jgi:8-oxo-dGTP diphosphatase
MSFSDKANGAPGVIRAVTAVIEDASGRVLLCQQQGGHRKWGLPGGKIRSLESPLHAAVREIRAETGAESELIDLVGLYTLTGTSCGDDVPDLVVHVFRARLTSEEAAVNAPGRICRLAWSDRDALPEPLTATTRMAIIDACAGHSGVLRQVQRDAEPEVLDAV